MSMIAKPQGANGGGVAFIENEPDDSPALPRVFLNAPFNGFWSRGSNMLLPIVLSLVIFGQNRAPAQPGAAPPPFAVPPSVSPQPFPKPFLDPPVASVTLIEKTTTLIVVGSRGSDARATEYLVMREKDGTISWSFIDRIGYTREGIDPEGVVEANGTIDGDSKLLTGAFRAMLGEITEKKPPKRDKGQRVPADFSLILVNSEGVKTCELWSLKQRMRLVHGGELKDLFGEVRKKVFGVGYLMPDLLLVGKDPYLGEPKVPLQYGPPNQLPPLPKGN